MWQVVAEEDIYCTECHHKISLGVACLSQMPLTMPANFSRRKYENFCIECADCDADVLACYVRRLNHWYTPKEKTSGSSKCGCCSDPIPDGTLTVGQKVYAWPDSETSSASNGHGQAKHGGPGSGVVVGTVTKPAPAGWHNLSRSTQRLFETRGLGRGLRPRSPEMAKRLYEREVPAAIRRMGESAVGDFLGGKHFSHIRAVANDPARARAPSNVLLENASANLSRGSRNMTSAGRAAARSASRASAIRTGARATLRSSARAGFIAAAVEATVSVPENVLHYRRGRKSGGQATRDTLKSTATAACVGAATAGVSKGVAMVGVGLSFGPLGTPLMIAGGVVLAGSAACRIAKAAERDLPLDEYQVFLCKNERCKNRFAQDISEAAATSRGWRLGQQAA